MRHFTKEEQKKYTEAVNKMFKPVKSKKEKLLAKHILELQADKGRLTDRVRELEAQIEKMKCCKEEIIKALKETLDYEWLHAHNGKAKYLYLQTVIDIVNEKFKEIKEK